MTGVANWLTAWRLFVLALGTFNFGFVLYMAIEYARGHLRISPYRNAGHVVAISLSYMALTAELCTEIGLRAIRNDEIISYRLGLATIAFPLGTYALARLITAANDYRRADLASAHDAAVVTEQETETAHDAAKETVAQIDTAIAQMEDEGREP